MSLIFMNICSISVTSGTKKRMLHARIELVSSICIIFVFAHQLKRTRIDREVRRREIQRIHMLFSPCLMTIAKTHLSNPAQTEQYKTRCEKSAIAERTIVRYESDKRTKIAN